MEGSNETTLTALRAPAAPIEVGFSTSESYGLMKKIAVDFAGSDLVPKRFQNKAPNCMIALNMAIRMKADPLMVMQNLYVVHGTPSWSSAFMIACFNQCGRFSPIRYVFEGEKGKEDWGCRAVSSYLADATPIEGPLVTIAIAKAEGWYGKDGSKWKTMPEQMLRYRVASWMIRSTAPEIGMGFQTREEIEDTYDLERAPSGHYEITTQDVQSDRGTSSEKTPVLGASAGKKSEAAAATKNTAPSASTGQNSPTTQTASSAAEAAHAGKAAPEQPQMAPKHEPTPFPPEMVPCPNRGGKDVDELNCAACPSRNGCPTWE